MLDKINGDAAQNTCLKWKSKYMGMRKQAEQDLAHCADSEGSIKLSLKMPLRRALKETLCLHGRGKKPLKQPVLRKVLVLIFHACCTSVIGREVTSRDRSFKVKTEVGLACMMLVKQSNYCKY